MEEFVQIADSALEEKKEELRSIVDAVYSSAIRRMYENGIPIRNYSKDGVCYQDSWEWIMMQHRIHSMMTGDIELRFLFQHQFDDLVRELEKTIEN